MSITRYFIGQCAERVLTPMLVAVALVIVAHTAQAQARPEGAGRTWLELGVGVAAQAQECQQCVRTGTIGGPTASGAVGVTLPRGFGVALLARAFQEFSYEHSQSSGYVVAMGQYSPPSASLLTLNAGLGWARHRGHTEAPYSNDGEGGAVAAGAALRIPPRTAVGLTLTADVIQAVSAAGSYHPRLVTIGIALNFATSTRGARGSS